MNIQSTVAKKPPIISAKAGLFGDDPNILLCRKDAARYLGVSPQTLATWHSSRRYDLPVVKIGRSAKYRLEDLDAFIVQNTHGNATSMRGAA